MHFQESTHVKVLTPHWFDDSIRLGMRDLPTEPYAWPEPEVLKSGRRHAGINKVLGNYDEKEELPRLTAEEALDDEKLAVLKGVLAADGSLKSSGRDVWEGKTILINADLELSEERRKTLAVEIKRSGGVVIDADGVTEADIVDIVDVFVTKYRWGEAYVKVCCSRQLLPLRH